jgi:alpha-N-arabinofuranosidase
MSYYVQKLFADYQGTETLPVTATGGGFGPMYWSATKSSTATILKIVNHNGNAETVVVNLKGSSATTATLVTLTAPNSTSVNNLPGLGGIATKLTTTTIKGSDGTFSVPVTNPYEIVVLSVET